MSHHMHAQTAYYIQTKRACHKHVKVHFCLSIPQVFVFIWRTICFSMRPGSDEDDDDYDDVSALLSGLW